MNYTLIIEHEWLGCTGRFPDMPGCEVQGDDMEELMANVQSAVEAWAAENGLTELPRPSDIEPDFSDPRRIPMLVAVDSSFLTGNVPAPEQKD